MKRVGAILLAFMLIAVVAPTAGATAKPAASVLVLGDSVFNAFTHVDTATALLNRQQRTILATQGCQRLLKEGCLEFAKLSALQQLRRHAGKFTDVVVVGTGYNDRLGPDFKKAVLAIVEEAEVQGVDVLWVTYREAGNVRGKSRVLNDQLRRLDARLERLYVVDWNEHSEAAQGWFREDDVHLVTRGAVELARLLNASIKPIIEARTAAAQTVTP